MEYISLNDIIQKPNLLIIIILRVSRDCPSEPRGSIIKVNCTVLTYVYNRRSIESCHRRISKTFRDFYQKSREDSRLYWKVLRRIVFLIMVTQGGVGSRI